MDYHWLSDFRGEHQEALDGLLTRILASLMAEELLQDSVTLVAPFGSRERDPRARFSSILSRLRYRIDTVFGQLVDRYQAKRVWAKDSWHLRGRLLRKVLSHTVAFLLN